MAHYDLPHHHGQDIQRVLARMPEVGRFGEVARFFALVGDPTRLRIFWVLCHCTECVTNLGVMMGASKAVVSHHLQVLRRAGLIVSERQGKEVHYSLAQTREARLLHRSVDAIFDMRINDHCELEIAKDTKTCTTKGTADCADFGQIGGRLPPTGLPGMEIAQDL